MGNESGWAPEWLARLGLAAWLVDPDGHLTYVNPRAETLLKVKAADCLGLPCHRVIHGKNEASETVCERSCAVRRMARGREEIQPLLIQRETGGDSPDWILVTFIPLAAPEDGGLHILHLAYSMNGYRRMHRYMENVLGAGRRSFRGRPSRDVLSRRELEVLVRLADGEDPKRIARELFVSYVTVRNHVQHILRKLSVHSISEAVALHLLFEGEGTSPGSNDARASWPDHVAGP